MLTYIQNILGRRHMKLVTGLSLGQQGQEIRILSFISSLLFELIFFYQVQFIFTLKISYFSKPGSF